MAEAKKSAKQADVVKSLDELRKELTVKQQDLLESRRSHKAGELVNPRVLRTTHKEIARLKTAIRTAELKESE